MARRTLNSGVEIVLPVAVFFLFLSIGGWLQHLYTCFSQGKWGFLIAGAICFPVAVIHGWGIWLGIW